jgi:hypothetical protein
MEKLVLFSIVAATIAVPAVAATERNARVALRKALVWMVIGIAVYVGCVVFVYPRLQG